MNVPIEAVAFLFDGMPAVHEIIMGKYGAHTCILYDRVFRLSKLRNNGSRKNVSSNVHIVHKFPHIVFKALLKVIPSHNKIPASLYLETASQYARLVFVFLNFKLFHT